MRSLTVERTIAAPRERVFEVIADHGRYARFRDIRKAELLKEGDPAPNGAGAVRRVFVGPLRFDERITVYEPPSRMDYLILRVNVPFEHQGGTMRLLEEDGGTRVEWTTTFGVPTPVIGGVQELIWVRVLTRGFRRTLEDVERVLEAARFASR